MLVIIERNPGWLAVMPNTHIDIESIFQEVYFWMN